MRQGRIHLSEAEQRMAAEQASHLQAGAAIGHVREVEVEFFVHLEAEEMRRRSCLIGRVAQLAAVGLGPGDEFAEGVGRHAGIDDERERRLHAADNRPELIERPAGVGERIGIDLGERLGAEPKNRPVGRCIRDILGGKRAACAGLVLDDDRLAERPRHMLRNHPRVGIDGAARHGADDDANDPALRQR